MKIPMETPARRACTRALGIVLGAALLGSCGGGGGEGATAQSLTPNAAPPASPAPGAALQTAPASVAVPLEVPAALAQEPFAAGKSLVVPPGFGIRVWARVNKARFMALAPNGDVLVSVPSEGKIVLLREQANGTPQAFDYATGLRNPHDMVFHTIGNTTYLYVAESNRITRSVYQAGETATGARDTVVADLPDSSLAELGGTYGHELKNIALSPDHKLYVSVASACNACAEDTASDPVRGAIYQYSADGGERVLYARGLRNAEGLDFIPGTNTLWLTVNNRDEIKVPLDADLDGDGSSDLGKILPSFVDDFPPELFTPVRNGGNYGWPFCNSVPNATMSNLDLLPDFDLNRDGAALNCATVDRSVKGIRAHSAPLGFSFLQASAVPAAYRSGAAVAQHGCWNCTTLRAGYKVSYFPFDGAGNAGAEFDLVTGFVTDPVARSVWGRPVDVIPDARGNLLISDDYANAIYQLYPR
ncbi:PQQ-dependent sugar dehydrogenase [Noviherbaspirillum malthae]|jgi:glucose/arabinose dehydrogenase|uniref:PQQ-dependent sugar dehydrogenase n=1 Tax=Noviherbaspirillum malthae TaxID=1260987 RepID=UPI00188EA898|nr:sugar dehydrogenase [Noviherbaspirillum malthae]